MLKKVVSVFIIILFTLETTVYAIDDKLKDVYKVGLYENEPYMYTNDNGEYSGVYYDLLEAMAKELGIKFEYVNYEFSKVLDALYNGDIDIVPGLQKNYIREGNFLFTDNYVAVEKYGIYTNKYAKYGEVETVDKLKFAIIKGDFNAEFILNILKNKGIKVTSIEVENDKEAIRLFEEGNVDAITIDISNLNANKYRCIFEYSVGAVYIAANQGDKVLISEIDKLLSEYKALNENPLIILQSKYFNKEYQFEKDIITTLLKIIMLCVIIFLMILLKSFYPKIKLKKDKKNIEKDINSNKYILYYQPIVNPKKNKIVGFEALMRYKDEKLGILTPISFLNKIECSDMNKTVSIWVIKRVLEDYKKIKMIDNISIDDNCYISLNLSVIEIEDSDLRKTAITMLKDSNISKGLICLEIIERVGIKDLNKIQNAVRELREAGYLIAIDDFGVEYSNLDMLEKIDFDVVKLDKYFIDNIEYSDTRKKIMDFLSDISLYSNMSIIAEGVEKASQRDIIKSINNDRFYIQGYLYSKPIDIDEISDIHIID